MIESQEFAETAHEQEYEEEQEILGDVQQGRHHGFSVFKGVKCTCFR